MNSREINLVLARVKSTNEEKKSIWILLKYYVDIWRKSWHLFWSAIEMKGKIRILMESLAIQLLANTQHMFEYRWAAWSTFNSVMSSSICKGSLFGHWYIKALSRRCATTSMSVSFPWRMFWRGQSTQFLLLTTDNSDGDKAAMPAGGHIEILGDDAATERVVGLEVSKDDYRRHRIMRLNQGIKENRSKCAT